MKEKHSQIHCQWLSFAELTTSELYQLLQLRQQVFVVEQHCPYLDADGLDAHAWHLLASRTVEGQTTLVACLRVLFPGIKYSGPAIGRFATALAVRGQGLGRELMHKGLYHTAIHYPGQPISISAQLYLEDFYTSFGFSRISAPYDEDGILHIDMLFPAKQHIRS